VLLNIRGFVVFIKLNGCIIRRKTTPSNRITVAEYAAHVGVGGSEMRAFRW